MSLDLVIGHKGEDHVTASDFARMLKLIFGPTESYENYEDCLILRKPELSALVSDNTITLSIAGGYYSICGRFAYSLNTTTLTVPGVITSGNRRKDAIIVEFNRVNNIESVEYKIIQGTESSSTPSLPALPYETGNPEVNATYQMLIGILNINGSNVSCESLEERGELKANRVRSLYNCYENYIKNLPAVTLNGSCVSYNGSSTREDNILFGILKPIDISFFKNSSGKLEVVANNICLIDYLGDIYKVSNDSKFQLPTELNKTNKSYLAELDIVLDIKKYFNYHEQHANNSNFPLTTSMKLLRPLIPYLKHKNGKIYIDTSLKTSDGQLTLGEVSTYKDEVSGYITFKIPLVYISDLDTEIYSINNPGVFREDCIFPKTFVENYSEVSEIEIPGRVVSVTNQDIKFPVGYTVTKVERPQTEPESSQYHHVEIVHIPQSVGVPFATVTYLVTGDSSRLDSIIQPSA